MEKTVLVDGRAVRFKASAAVPRLYRIKFGRDIISDMNRLKKSFDKAQSALNIPKDTTPERREELTRDAQLSAMDLTLFENVSYIMARHADPEGTPNSPDAWLESFNMFSIYVVLPELLDLWGQNLATTAVPKNAQGRQHAR